MAYRRTDDELHDKLSSQIKFLRKSAEDFDLGELDEAERIAAALYVLLYDGGSRTKSLLGQLNLINDRDWISTALAITETEPDAIVLMAAPPLTRLKFMQNAARYVPHCQVANVYPSWSRRLPFVEWWNETITSNGRNELSRRSLVHYYRSQDGGGHVDRDIHSHYHELIAEPYSGTGKITVTIGAVEVATTGANHASLRQIAWELDVILTEAGY